MPRAQCNGLVWGGASYQLLIGREHSVCFYPTHFQKIVNVCFSQHHLQTFYKYYLNLCGSNCIQLALGTPYLRRASVISGVYIALLVRARVSGEDDFFFLDCFWN